MLPCTHFLHSPILLLPRARHFSFTPPLETLPSSWAVMLIDPQVPSLSIGFPVSRPLFLHSGLLSLQHGTEFDMPHFLIFGPIKACRRLENFMAQKMGCHVQSYTLLLECI